MQNSGLEERGPLERGVIRDEGYYRGGLTGLEIGVK